MIRKTGLLFFVVILLAGICIPAAAQMTDDAVIEYVKEGMANPRKIDMDLFEKTVKSQHIYQGKVVDLWLDTVVLPDGNEASREVINHPGGVCVLAVDESNNAFIVKQYRKGNDGILMEIPAGKLEYGEDVETAALRELREETGVIASDLVYLGYFYPTPAYCREKIHMYFAKNLMRTSTDLDDDEFVEAFSIPFDELYKMVLNDEITDGKTALAVLKARGLGLI